MPRTRLLLLIGSLTALAACQPSVGRDCSADDMRAARTVAYDPSGQPAFAGQAILIASCAGGGAFCHSESASFRYGAPHDLNFDPILADDPRYVDRATGEAHLYSAQLQTHHWRDDIYATVYSGSMPPGQAGADTRAAPYVQYASETATEGTPLPGLDTEEGLEMLRVWLACGSPVVEATTSVPPAECMRDEDCAPLPLCDLATSRCVPVGSVVARRASSATATWSSIYTTILRPTCALDACHGSAGASLSGNLDLSSADVAYAALVGVSAQSSACGTRVVAGNPDGSLLVAKLENTQDPLTCGSSMPVGTALPGDEIALIRSWIAGGAMQD